MNREWRPIYSGHNRAFPFAHENTKTGQILMAINESERQRRRALQDGANLRYQEETEREIQRTIEHAGGGAVAERRLTEYITGAIREGCRGFIGENASPRTKRAISGTVQSVLRSLEMQGLYKDWHYEVADVDPQVGLVNISISVNPIHGQRIDILMDSFAGEEYTVPLREEPKPESKPEPEPEPEPLNRFKELII